MKEYEKIEAIFERNNITKKVIEGCFRSNVVGFLKDNKWHFTEKIDGTNIRVYWDGHSVSIKGRTDSAEIPKELYAKLSDMFLGNENEEIFEQQFGGKQVMFIGEGYGGKIQRGTNYRDDESFILFDVSIDDTYLTRESVENIAEYFNLDVVPVVFSGTLQEGVDYVKSKPKSNICGGTAMLEGLVARPAIELKDRMGKRIITKIKVRDLV